MPAKKGNQNAKKEHPHTKRVFFRCSTELYEWLEKRGNPNSVSRDMLTNLACVSKAKTKEIVE